MSHPYKKCKYVFSTFLILIFYIIKTNHVIRIKNTENCAITYHEKPCFVRFLYGFSMIFIRFSYNFHTIPYIIYTEITRNYQKLCILIKEITYICYGIFRPKLIVIMPANFIIYNL